MPYVYRDATIGLVDIWADIQLQTVDCWHPDRIALVEWRFHDNNPMSSEFSPYYTEFQVIAGNLTSNPISL